MKRKATRHRQTVKMLTEPQPQFVSLVTAGANQTPWTAVKIDKVEDAPTVEQDTAENVEVGKQDGYDIARIEFPKSAFDAQEVQDWLNDGGYTGYHIVERDDAYVVENDRTFAAVKAIETENDIVIYVGDENPESKAEPSDARPAPEDAGTSVQSAQATIKAEGNDTGEPKSAEVTDPQEAPEQEAAGEEPGGNQPSEEAQAEPAREETAKALIHIDDLVHVISILGMVVSERSDEESFGARSPGLADRLKAAATEIGEILKELSAEEAQALQDAIAAKLATSKNKTTSPDAPGEQQDQPSDAGWQAALSEVIKTVGSLSASVGQIAATVKTHQEHQKEADTQAAKLQERIDTLEAARPARKGSEDDGETVELSDEDEDARWAREHRLRSSLGFSRPLA